MEPPLMPNPNGALPDYENGPSLLPAVVALGVPAIAISAMTMGLRLYANMKHSGRLGLDDGKYYPVKMRAETDSFQLCAFLDG